MANLIEKIPTENLGKIPLHFLTATSANESESDMISYFNTEGEKIDRIGTDFKLFCNHNKHICKFKI